MMRGCLLPVSLCLVSHFPRMQGASQLVCGFLTKRSVYWCWISCVCGQTESPGLLIPSSHWHYSSLLLFDPLTIFHLSLSILAFLSHQSLFFCPICPCFSVFCVFLFPMCHCIFILFICYSSLHFFYQSIHPSFLLGIYTSILCYCLYRLFHLSFPFLFSLQASFCPSIIPSAYSK